MKLTELAETLGAEAYFPANTEDVVITQIMPVEQAKEGAITFISNHSYIKHLKTTKASAVIVGEKVADCHLPQIIHRNPYLAFAKVAQMFHRPNRGPIGISENAFIASDAVIADDVTIYPFVFVGSGVKIGENVVLMPGVSIMDNTIIGDGTVVYSNASIYHDCVIGNHCIIHAGCVIGSDGFGYAIGDGSIEKIPQVGNVVLEDCVEVGALTTIDRAAMGSTRIGKGCKLDSRVQIAHNVELGEHCMMSAFSGVAGSGKLGNWVIVGGHSGINGHINICDGARIGGMTGVVESLEEPGDYIGFPAKPARQWHRAMSQLYKQNDINKRLKVLEKKLLSDDDAATTK